MCGYQYCGVSTTPGDRGLSPTWFISCLRTIQMVGVFGAGKAMCFGPLEWDRRLEILDYSDNPGWVWRLPSGGPNCVFVMIWTLPN